MVSVSNWSHEREFHSCLCNLTVWTNVQASPDTRKLCLAKLVHGASAWTACDVVWWCSFMDFAEFRDCNICEFWMSSFSRQSSIFMGQGFYWMCWSRGSRCYRGASLHNLYTLTEVRPCCITMDSSAPFGDILQWVRPFHIGDIVS